MEHINAQATSLIDFKNHVVEALNREKESIKQRLAQAIIDRDVKEEEKREAAKQGDLSENAEYHAAVEALKPIAEQIGKLEQLSLAYNSKVYNTITSDKVHTRVDIGTVVRLKLKDGPSFLWMVVPSIFASLEMHTLSDNSPVGSHLLGLIKGSDFEITMKGKLLNYTVQEIL